MTMINYRYSICFQNSMTIKAPKPVSVYSSFDSSKLTNYSINKHFVAKQIFSGFITSSALSQSRPVHNPDFTRTNNSIDNTTHTRGSRIEPIEKSILSSLQTHLSSTKDQKLRAYNFKNRKQGNTAIHSWKLRGNCRKGTAGYAVLRFIVTPIYIAIYYSSIPIVEL